MRTLVFFFEHSHIALTKQNSPSLLDQWEFFISSDQVSLTNVNYQSFLDLFKSSITYWPMITLNFFFDFEELHLALTNENSPSLLANENSSSPLTNEISCKPMRLGFLYNLFSQENPQNISLFTSTLIHIHTHTHKHR